MASVPGSAAWSTGPINRDQSWCGGDRPSRSGWTAPALSLVLAIDNALIVDVAGLGHGRAGAAEVPLPRRSASSLLCLRNLAVELLLVVHLITDPA